MITEKCVYLFVFWLCKFLINLLALIERKYSFVLKRHPAKHQLLGCKKKEVGILKEKFGKKNVEGKKEDEKRVVQGVAEIPPTQW